MNTDDKEENETTPKESPYTEAAKADKVEEKKSEENSEPKDGKSDDAAENSDEEKKKAAEDDKKKSEEAEKDPTEKSEEKPDDKWRKKFDKQTSNYQGNMEKTAAKRYSSEKLLVEAKPERLIELAASADDDDIKLARKISGELYNGLSLEDAIKEIQKVRTEAGEEEETPDERERKLKSSLERKYANENALKDFSRENPILDSKSDEYDKEVAKKFERKLESMKGDGEMLADELSEKISDAFYLATRDVEKKQAAKETKKAQEKIAGAGSGTKSQTQDNKEKKESPYAKAKEAKAKEEG